MANIGNLAKAYHDGSGWHNVVLLESLAGYEYPSSIRIGNSSDTVWRNTNTGYDISVTAYLCNYENPSERIALFTTNTIPHMTNGNPGILRDGLNRVIDDFAGESGLAWTTLGFYFMHGNETISDTTVLLYGGAETSVTKATKYHTVTWNLNGGTGGPTSTSVVHGGTPTHVNTTKGQDTEYTYAFAAWQKNGSDVVLANERITEPVTYTARYTPTKRYYSITTGTSPANAGTVSAPTSKQWGETVTLSQTPAADYEFVKWQLNGEDLQGDSFTMSKEDVTVTAVYREAHKTVKRYTNGAFVECVPYYYDGETFVEVEPRYWDGTQWIPQTISREVFDTIDGKANVFVSAPTNHEYKANDLWVNATYPGTNYNNDVLRCKSGIDRAAGEFDINDWQLASKYTDDSKLIEFLGNYTGNMTGVLGLIDEKIETYYQGTNPALNWASADYGKHTGDLWYCTAEIKQGSTVLFGKDATYRWNGTAWEFQNAPKEVFDRIDGKAQVYTGTSLPTPPYFVGDLWFPSTQDGKGEIYTCVTKKTATQTAASSDWKIRNGYTENLQNFIDNVYTPAMDGVIDTYFYSYVPTLSNVPASQWTDTATKDKHLDDLFYNTTTGFVYRFTKSGSTYAWTQIRDQDIATALQTANTAKDTADGKRRVFTAQPTTQQAYDVGDLWANATYPLNSQNPTYSNELLRCATKKESGTAFDINHWIRADGSLQSFITNNYERWQDEVNGQLDGKIETYYQATNPATAWTDSETKSKHEGDLWYSTQDIIDGNNHYQQGMTYRWTKTGTNPDTYEWEDYGGVPSEVFDEIEGKAQVFIRRPVDPEDETKSVGYNEGDLWIEEETGKILTCTTPRPAGDDFDRSDWSEKIQYTDKSTLNSAVSSLDSKFENKDAARQAEISDIQTTVRTIGTSLTINNEYVQISHSHNNNILRLSGGEVKMMLGTDTLTYWNTNEMYTPKKVRIPTTAEGADAGNGGSLQIGGLVFQPRSNGNMSIMWVGDSTLSTTSS